MIYSGDFSGDFTPDRAAAELLAVSLHATALHSRGPCHGYVPVPNGRTGRRGGGTVRMKMSCPTADFIRCTKATVADVTVSRAVSTEEPQ